MSIPVYGPVRVIEVGAGVMGRLWLKAIADSADAELVGVVDLDHRAALNATDEAGFSGVPVGASLAEFAGDLADAVINVTVPMAHRPVSIDAMFQGFPVLCEKPACSNKTDPRPHRTAGDPRPSQEDTPLHTTGQHRLQPEEIT